MEKRKHKSCGLRTYLLVLVVAVCVLALPTIGKAKVAIALSRMMVDFNDYVDDSSQYAYLSDYDPITASVGYDKFRRDETESGAKISVWRDGAKVSFSKGLWAHANSNVYYDLDATGVRTKGLDRLRAYVGLNTTSTSGDGVKFWIYGSNDEEVANGQNLTGTQYWTVIYNSEGKVSQPGQDADYIDLDVSGYRFVRLQAAGIGNITADHAVWADIKLTTPDYQKKFVDSYEVLDQEIKAIGNFDPVNDKTHELMTLRRNFLKEVGQYSLTDFVNESAENREMLNWLYNDVDVLRMYTTGGRPAGTYWNSLEVLSELYHEFRSDLEDRTPLMTASGQRKDLYQKMMITLSLTHSKQVRFWIRDQGEMAGNPNSPNISRPVDRYLVLKRMYLAGKLNTQIFEQLEVEEMRYVMYTEMGDDELEWLNDWMKAIGKAPYSWPPLAYVSIGSHYWWDVNYPTDEGERQELIEQYKLKGSTYDLYGGKDKSISGNYLIGFEKAAPHLWMISKYGGVCWQTSNFGQNMQAAYGIPSTTMGQPGHVAYLNYELKSNGVAAWALTNDVSGWANTDYTGYTNINTYHQVRQMINWGTKDGTYGELRNRVAYQGAYITYAQAAMNDFDGFEDAEVLVKTADIYGEDLIRQEEILRKAVEAQEINFDAWYGLIVNYKKQGKSAEAWYDLAHEVADKLKNYTVPMYDLVQTIIAQIPASGGTVGYNMATELLLRDTLEWESKASNDELNVAGQFVQGSVSKNLANYLLGRLNNQIAVFSFDGEDAGVLKLGAKYENSNAAFEYSLDGGVTWSTDKSGEWVTEKRVSLSQAEIESITAENDIQVHVQGVPREGNIYTIDITKGVLPSNLYANDQENRVVGVNTTMEWCVIGVDGECGEWVSYATASPLRTGDMKMKVRVGATKTYLPSDASAEFVFTQDTDTLTRKYIPVSHLSVARVSSQATGGGQYGNASYAIDGNFYTRWHSAWNGSDHERWMVIEFDQRVELSALGYVAPQGGNGRILDAEFYASTEEGLRAEDFAKVGVVKRDCSDADVLCSESWSSNANATVDNFVENAFEFRRVSEDGTVISDALTNVKYIAIKVTRTSDSGQGFVGARMFNFYEDRTQNPAPTGGVGYSTTDPTNGSVIARLINLSEEVDVIDEAGNVLGDAGREHVFTENGEHVFRFRKKGDVNGKVGMARAKVDWIYKEVPEPEVVYYCADGESDAGDIDCSGTQRVNRSVSVRLVFPEWAQVTVLNNGVEGEDSSFTHLFMRNGEFTFEYEDAAGNHGSKRVEVNWIDKAAPKVDIEYSTTDETEGEVVARLVKVEIPVMASGNEQRLSAMRIDDDLYKYDENGLEYGEEFIVENNGGSAEYRFTENGEFEFRYRDVAGNYGTIKARVDWIKDKEAAEKPGGSEDSNGPGASEIPGGDIGGSSDAGKGPEVSGGQSTGESVSVSNGDNNSGVVKIEAAGLPEGAEVINKALTLPSALKQKFGANSGYFELSFVSENGEDVRSEEVKITVAKGKKLVGVYLVKDDGTTEKVEYEVLSDGQIRIKNPKAGKYLLDYEDEGKSEGGVEKADDEGRGEESDVDENGKSWYETPVLWWGLGGVVLLAGLALTSKMADNRRRN